jgi:hypothetical protein
MQVMFWSVTFHLPTSGLGVGGVGLAVGVGVGLVVGVGVGLVVGAGVAVGLVVGVGVGVGMVVGVGFGDGVIVGKVGACVVTVVIGCGGCDTGLSSATVY